MAAGENNTQITPEASRAGAPLAAPASLCSPAPDGPLPFFPYRFMGIDAGSNAIKYRVWEVEEDGTVRQLSEQRFPVRLGRGVFRTGLLDGGDIDAAVAAFRKIAAAARELGVHGVRAAATSAMREARNSAELARRVEQEAGIRLEILPDEEEARLIGLGVLGAQGLRPGPGEQILMLDIGGGSTEVILAEGAGEEENFRFQISDFKLGEKGEGDKKQKGMAGGDARGPRLRAASIRLGAVRLREMFFENLPPPPAQLEQVKGYIENELDKALRLPPPGPGAQCLGSSGTITVLTTMTGALGRAPDGTITRGEVEAIAERAARLTVAETEAAFGIDTARAEVILTGTLVLAALLRRTGAERLRAVRGGVGDGLLWDLLQRGK